MNEVPSAPTRRRLPARRPPPGGRHLVLYDGVCGLCDRAVRFLLAVDREGVLTYAPLQGPSARSALERLGLGELAPDPAGDAAPDSMVFVRDEGTARERALVRSAGMLATLDAVGGVWRLASWLRVVPVPIRDAVYRWIAANRYRWFGRYDACRLPSPEVRARFVD